MLHRKLLIAAICLSFFSACGMTARVIKQDDNSAVIQGVGPTEFEAKESAKAKATELLGSAKETQAAECNQEYKHRGSSSSSGSYSSKGKTYYSCVMYFAKS